MRYLSVTYQWRILTRPQVAGFKCPVTYYSLCLYLLVYYSESFHKAILAFIFRLA